MRILNAIHAQTIGGVDQVFRNYTEVLIANGHEVGLLVSNNGNDQYPIPGTKKIFRLKNLSQISDFFHLLWILILFRPAVIFCHSNRLMKWMKILKFFTKTKSIAINHGISFKSSLYCDYIISINQQIADLVVKAGFDQNKSFKLPNVIKFDQTYRKKILKNPPKIGIYGRIEPRKGFDILIKAGGLLAKSEVDFCLKIGGFEVSQNYNFQTLSDLAKQQGILEKCEFVGVVLDKKKFFTDVDIFCVPSREEPFGLVILEAFLNSALVISSDSDGGKFLIKNGENGLLFANENHADLAKKIIEAISHPEIYHNLTEAAFLRLAKEFSFDFLEQEIEKILQKIVLAKCSKRFF